MNYYLNYLVCRQVILYITNYKSKTTNEKSTFKPYGFGSIYM